MAIVVQNSHGWLLDHRQSMTNNVKGSGYQCVASLFLTGKHGCRPYTQNSPHQIAPLTTLPTEKEKPVTATESTSTRKKKRKRRPELNLGEIHMLEYHQKHCSFIELAGKQLISAGADYFAIQRKQLQCSVTNQIPDPPGLPLPPPSLSHDKGKNEIVLCEGTNELEDINNSRVTNSSNCTCSLRTAGSTFIIPARSSFLISDFTSVRQLLLLQSKFDAVVIDPPWENKSVKRSKGYTSLPEHDLKKIPLKPLTSLQCLLFMWVTNKQKYVRFVEERLLGLWGFELVGHWHWLKVSVEGDPVCDYSSVHKKPYEVLVVAKKKGSSLVVPQSKVLCSIPSAIHSQKPCLKEIIEEYIGVHSQCLELFARNLVPGWTSWGNEVLKFQNTEYYEQLQ